MKNKNFLLLFSLFVCFNTFGQITWDGGGADNNFSTANNWSSNSVPTSTDDVVFDGTSSKDCDFDVAIDILGLTIASSYTGTIDALTQDVLIRGNFSQDGGTFIAPDNTSSSGLVLKNDFSFTGGTFTHNSGFVIFDVDPSNGATVINGAVTFNDITINALSGSGQRNVDFGTSTTSVLNLNLSSFLFGFQGDIDITSDLNLAGTNTGNPAGNNANFSFSGGGPITINGINTLTNRHLRVRLPNIVMNTSGNYSIVGNLNVSGNWTGTQGALTVGSSTVNFHGSGAILSGTASAFDNLTVLSGANLSLPTSGEVTIARNLVNSGTISSAASSLLGFNGGTTNQSISGTAFTVGSIRAFGGTRNLTLNTGLTIQDSLKLEPNVTFVTGGNLTLEATINLTGRIAELGSGASVSGDVMARTYVPGPKTGWANWGSNGVNGQTVGNWELIIPMTCQGCIYGVTGIGSYFESIQGWDPDTDLYDTSLTVNSTLVAGKGFWVYVGDGPTDTNDFTLMDTGTVVQGTQNIPISNNNFLSGDNLIANPFASPISWDRILTANSTNTANLNSTAIFVYNADLGVTTDYSPGSGSSHASGITSSIPAGQGFYVSVTAGQSFNLNIGESQKVSTNTGANPLLKTSQTSTSTKFRLKVNGFNEESDETLLHFNQNATVAFDKLYDARKKFQTPGYVGYPGTYTKYTTISTKSLHEDYSINALPDLTFSTTIAVMVKVMATGSYTISAGDFENFSSCLVLVDKLFGTYHNLLDAPYVCTINDSTNSARFELIICESGNITPVGIKELSSGSANINFVQDPTGVEIKTKFEKDTRAIISVYTILGQKLMADTEIRGAITSTHLNLPGQQILFITVSTDKESVTKKLVTY